MSVSVLQFTSEQQWRNLKAFVETGRHIYTTTVFTHVSLNVIFMFLINGHIN